MCGISRVCEGVRAGIERRGCVQDQRVEGLQQGDRRIISVIKGDIDVPDRGSRRLCKCRPACAECKPEARHGKVCKADRRTRHRFSVRMGLFEKTDFQRIPRYGRIPACSRTSRPLRLSSAHPGLFDGRIYLEAVRLHRFPRRAKITRIVGLLKGGPEGAFQGKYSVFRRFDPFCGAQTFECRAFSFARKFRATEVFLSVGLRRE